MPCSTGLAVADLDFTTDARPETRATNRARLGRRVVGHRHRVRHHRRHQGTQRWRSRTFPRDSYDQVSRNPRVRFGDTLEGDLVRRDFTANAIAVRIDRRHRGTRRIL